MHGPTVWDRQRKIALTFDDGPDPRYTPLILEILRRKHVPATFFIVGSNGQRIPGAGRPRGRRQSRSRKSYLYAPAGFRRLGGTTSPGSVRDIGLQLMNLQLTQKNAYDPISKAQRYQLLYGRSVNFASGLGIIAQFDQYLRTCIPVYLDNTLRKTEASVIVDRSPTSSFIKGFHRDKTAISHSPDSGSCVNITRVLAMSVYFKYCLHIAELLQHDERITGYSGTSQSQLLHDVSNLPQPSLALYQSASAHAVIFIIETLYRCQPRQQFACSRVVLLDENFSDLNPLSTADVRIL